MRIPPRDHAPNPSFDELDAIVVFEPRPAKGLFRLLRPSFRHCFCLIRRPAGWLLCDPLFRTIRLEMIEDEPAGALAVRLSRAGRTVIIGRTSRPKPGAGLSVGPATCVEVVKRVIGRHDCATLTPWRLFRFLTRDRRAAPNFVVFRGENEIDHVL